ncbi:hypothetical protein OG618_26680 [Kitasatospora sp. NBC_01246]|uniref:hypothetical protein n=1 Tax=Kitasatospora sp. NBC_01246 TaxID=2903570 RepID=UPI002E35548B|nr:hypothetical protein [Kitasatospora sp. NBC_01246]
MRSRIALTALAVTALAAAATACGPENSDAPAAGAAPTTAPPAASAPAAAPSASAPGTPAAPGKSAAPAASTKPTATTPAAPAPGSPGDKTGYGQACGTNDLTFGAKMETQAGGYILVTAKAKAGITCVLPATHPVIAFGSGGIEARNAEQAAGAPITLTGSAVAYVGINPKSTNTDQNIEFKDVIIGISAGDPDPASIPVGSVKVDKPVVTNWHTNAKDAVPGV